MSHTVSLSTVPIRSITALRAAITALAATGINISLEENATPRNYYRDQYQRHLKRPNEVADFVIRLPDAHYDIGLLKEEDGTYSTHFDDYGHPGHLNERGKKAIKDILGIPAPGMTEHWSGQKKNPLQAQHSVAKFLNSYTEHAALEIAGSQGMLLESCEVMPDGSRVMTFASM